MFISSLLLWIIWHHESGVYSLLSPSRMPGGAPCWSSRKLSFASRLVNQAPKHQETALDKVSKNLWQSYQRLHLVNNYNYNVTAWLINTLIAVSDGVGALVDQQINLRAYRYLVLPLVCLSRLVSCHSAVWLFVTIYNAVNRLVCQFLFYFI